MRILALAVCVALVSGCGVLVNEKGEQRSLNEGPGQPAAPTFALKVVNPTIDSITVKLSAPLTTWAAIAHDPEGGEVHLSWHMAGEACGTPMVPWDQDGPTARWTHSDQKPDNCSHTGTDHAVIVTLTATTQNGPNRGAQGVCTIRGTEDQVITAAQVAVKIADRFVCEF